jgi:hypothetical protein
MDARERVGAAAARAAAASSSILAGGLPGSGGGTAGLTPSAASAAAMATFDANEAKEARERKLIEQYAASECIFCGDIMIESVQDPFISLPHEEAEVRSWQIYHD